MKLTGRSFLTVLAIIPWSALPAIAQEAPVSLSNPAWERSCVGTTGSPSVAFSPDNRVITVILSSFAVDTQSNSAGKTAHLRRTCRVSFDAQLPAGYRAIFKAAQVHWSVIATGAAVSSAAVRLGAKQRGIRWTSPATIKGQAGSPGSSGIVKPPGHGVRTNCGGKHRLYVELRVRAAASKAGDAGRAEVDSIDVDAGIQDQLHLEACSTRQ